tara:strand:+ start:336 stop:1091 length:756 start_codon:yes stop_codon:yes gene_type:complete
MAKIAQTRFPDPPEQYDPRAFSELVRQLEQIVLQLNSSYQEDNRNEILRRVNFLQGDGNDQDGTGIALSDLSVNTGSASGGGTLSYNNSTGVFNFAPAVTANRINQVIQSSTSTVVSLTSTSLTDTGLSATITPTATSSKVLIQTYAQFGVPEIASGGDDTFIHLVRGSTSIGGAGNVDSSTFSMVNESGGKYESRYINTLYLDSPSTTSATTYKLQFKNRNSSKQAYFNRRGQDNLSSGQSYMILMEVLQ